MVVKIYYSHSLCLCLWLWLWLCLCLCLCLCLSLSLSLSLHIFSKSQSQSQSQFIIMFILLLLVLLLPQKFHEMDDGERIQDTPTIVIWVIFQGPTIISDHFRDICSFIAGHVLGPATPLQGHGSASRESSTGARQVDFSLRSTG